MKVHNVTGLREALEQLDTARLDEMLQAELEKETPDPDAVRLIVSVLEEREEAIPTDISPREQAAWQQYKRATKRPAKPRRRLAVAASAALVIGLLFTVVPQQAEAGRFWEMLQRWSENVIAYFSGEGTRVDAEYVFKTDNPGLQRVYDAVVELGITEPVVPMWLPEDFVVLTLETKVTPMAQSAFAWFSGDNGELVYKITVYTGEPAHQYYRDDSYYETFEYGGTVYNITRNNDRWAVVWSKDNIECLLTADCQVDYNQ